MIQRQQSLWLLLSTLGAFLSFELPFFSGAQLANNSGKAAFLTAGSTFILMILTGASIVVSVIALFLYKNRKLQLRLCLAGTALGILILVMYFIEMKKLTGSISLWAIFVFAVPVGYIMAARGIHRDEKLVKSLEKLR